MGMRMLGIYSLLQLVCSPQHCRYYVLKLIFCSIRRHKSKLTNDELDKDGEVRFTPSLRRFFKGFEQPEEQ
jgi:hypothetical protein